MTATVLFAVRVEKASELEDAFRAALYASWSPSAPTTPGSSPFSA